MSINWPGNGVDYASTPIMTILPAGATNVTISIPVTVDIIVEEAEMFDLNFTISSSLNHQITPRHNIKATAIITDDTSEVFY